MAERSVWEKACIARIGILGMRDPDIYSKLNIGDKARQIFYSWKRSKNPTLKNQRRMALALAIDVDVLVKGDPNTIAAVPVPNWNWLDDIAKYMHDHDAFDIPTWTEYCKGRKA